MLGKSTRIVQIRRAKSNLLNRNTLLDLRLISQIQQIQLMVLNLQLIGAIVLIPFNNTNIIYIYIYI